MLDRFLLFSSYMEELSLYDPEIRNMTPEEFTSWFNEYLSDDYCFTDTVVDGHIVGFVIISAPGSSKCYDGCDYHIAQAYIRPEYRRRGLMTKTMVDLFSKNKGSYCYEVLAGNDGAKAFWDKLFTMVHAIDIPVMMQGDLPDLQLYIKEVP